jgi:integrase
MPRKPILKQKFDEYIESMRQRNSSPLTLLSYGQTYDLYRARGFTKVDDDQVHAFIATYPNAATRNKMLSHLMSFAKWNGLDGVCVGRLTARMAKTPNTMPTVRSESEIDNFIQALYSIRRSAWGLALLMAHTGLRFSEAYAVQAGSLKDISGKLCVVVMGKGSKERAVPLNHYAETGAVCWVSRIKKPSVWQVRRAFKRAEKESGVRLLPKNFRSSLGTRLVNEGVAYETVAQIFGHESVDTTRRNYARLDMTMISEAMTHATTR